MQDPDSKLSGKSDPDPDKKNSFGSKTLVLITFSPSHAPNRLVAVPEGLRTCWCRCSRAGGAKKCEKNQIFKKNFSVTKNELSGTKRLANQSALLMLY
jgi:hypothetical protein